MQYFRSEAPRKTAYTYRYFALAIMVSIFTTSLFIASYPTSLLTVAIGLAMVVFSINLLFGVTLPISGHLGWQVGVGVFSGILGGLSSIWSPPVAMYLLARNVSKEEFIGASGFLFLAGCFPLAAGLILSGVLTLKRRCSQFWADRSHHRLPCGRGCGAISLRTCSAKSCLACF